MTWTQIKKEVLARHQHAIEHDADELRLVLGYSDGQRVPLAICRRENATVILARVATIVASQVVAMLRASTSLGVPLVVIGDDVCVRATAPNDQIESALQATARAALRLRSATAGARTDITAFAFAL